MAVKACWVEVSKTERSELKAWLRSETIAQGLAMRARIVLGSANGESIRELSGRLEVSQPTVCLWRRRFGELGIAGLRSRARSGAAAAHQLGPGAGGGECDDAGAAKCYSLECAAAG